MFTYSFIASGTNLKSIISKVLLFFCISILWISCGENNESDSPFLQTSYTFPDIYLRYLEENENTKITVRPLKKTIVDSLVTDNQEYLFSINEITIPKTQNITNQNWYVYEGNIPFDKKFDIKVIKKAEEEAGGYNIELPIKKFLNLNIEIAETAVLISWEGAPLLPNEELVVMVQSDNGLTHTEIYQSEESVNYFLLLNSKIEKLIPGKCRIYLVRKGRSLRTNEEFGYSISTEVYSNTIEIVL